MTDTQTRFDEFVASPQPLLIGDSWRQSQSGDTIDVIDPATEEVFAKASAGGAEDVDAAVKAARATLENPEWRDMPIPRRRQLMLDLADAIEKDGDFLSLVETRDNGMPLPVSRFFSVGLGIEALRYCAGWVGKMGGETYTPSHGDKHVYSVKEPVGVVGGIIPWNGPLAMAAEQMAAVMATGCTLVLKPSEITPLSAIRLGQLALEVGVPAGVLNIVNGLGPTAGAAIARHPGVDKVSFTGSVATGKTIMATASSTLKRVTLELGGKSPVIIFPDADLERAIPNVAAGIFSVSGQICAAGSRVYAHTKVFDQVVEGLSAIAKSKKLGSGLTEGIDMGPLVSQGQYDRVTGYIASGLEQGAGLVCGGGDRTGPGYFVAPTVLADTSADMKVVQEEIFGPVICVMRFDDESIDELAKRANETDYGLNAFVWTRDIGTAHRLARRIKSGTVTVNSGPFLDMHIPTGGFKQSGLGRQHGRQGLEAYLETKTIAVDLSEGAHGGH